MTQALKVVRAIYDAFFRGDIPAVLECLHDDIDWFFAGDPSEIPFAGRHRGKEQVAKFFGLVGENCDVKQYDLREMHEGNGFVLVIGHQIIRARPTDRTWETDFVHVHFVEGDRVKRLHEVYNTAPMVRAFAKGGKA